MYLVSIISDLCCWNQPQIFVFVLIDHDVSILSIPTNPSLFEFRIHTGPDLRHRTNKKQCIGDGVVPWLQNRGVRD